MNEEENFVDAANDFDERPISPQEGDIFATLPNGVKIAGTVDFLLNAACTDYVRDGQGAFATVKAIQEITILKLFKFSGLTTAAWAEGLDIAEVTWYKYRNKKTVPAQLMETAWRLAMESRATIRGLLSVSSARKLNRIKELLKDEE